MLVAIVIDPGDKSVYTPKEMMSFDIEGFISDSRLSAVLYSLTAWTSNSLEPPELSWCQETN